jgi:uncharacterized YigZ family protein
MITPGHFPSTGKCCTCASLQNCIHIKPLLTEGFFIFVDLASSFLTFSQKGEAIVKERGSKFIGIAVRITGEEDVKQCLDAAEQQYPGARHYCYAWRLGSDGERYRSNDDGEPSGSAGKPILGQLLANNVTNALVIVVRYFGGTLLGVGGLIQAYKAAAAEAIAAAGIEEQHVLCRYSVSFETADTSAVMRVLREHNAIMESNTYDTRSRITFLIKEMHRSQLELKFAELYRVALVAE